MFLYSFDSVAILILAFAAFLYVPPRRRWLLLFAVSFVLLLRDGPLTAAVPLMQAGVAYLMGPWIARKKSAVLFWLTMGILLAPWVYLKQTGVPPLGLSFYTFQILAYLIEVFWRRQAPEPDFGYLALYTTFFANKITGPIEGPGLLEKFKEISLVSGPEFYRCVLLIWFGAFEKFVIADHIAKFVTVPLARPDDYAGISLWAAVLLSKYQIFCDFSGASLVAVGLAGLFGLSLTMNFDRPFSARTLNEFWRRWHISLQIWIRTYVFYPLLSTRLARFGVFLPLLFTFVVFGLWHDLRWTFVAYGVLQAVLLWLRPERLFGGARSGAWLWLILPFNYIVLIALPSVLFRSTSLAQAWSIWSNLSFSGVNWPYFIKLDHTSLMAVLGLIAGHEIFLKAEANWRVFERLSRFNWAARMGLVLTLLGILLVLSSFGDSVDFIYSRF